MQDSDIKFRYFPQISSNSVNSARLACSFGCYVHELRAFYIAEESADGEESTKCDKRLFKTIGFENFDGNLKR